MGRTIPAIPNHTARNGHAPAGAELRFDGSPKALDGRERRRAFGRNLHAGGPETIRGRFDEGFHAGDCIMGELGQPSFSRTGPNRELSFSRTARRSPLARYVISPRHRARVPDAPYCSRVVFFSKVSKWRRADSNCRPDGYEPSELPLLHAAHNSLSQRNPPCL